MFGKKHIVEICTYSTSKVYRNKKQETLFKIFILSFKWSQFRGESGLFPEAYVEELIEDGGGGPPSMAPPPLPQDYNAPAPGQDTYGALDDWTADPWSAPPNQQVFK